MRDKFSRGSVNRSSSITTRSNTEKCYAILLWFANRRKRQANTGREAFCGDYYSERGCAESETIPHFCSSSSTHPIILNSFFVIVTIVFLWVRSVIIHITHLHNSHHHHHRCYTKILFTVFCQISNGQQKILVGRFLISPLK